MFKVLIPIDGSANSLKAVQFVINQFVSNSAMEVHLLNVQTPFPSDIARFVNARTRHEFHDEQAEIALAPARKMLDQFSIPYAVHHAVGDRARSIADTARRLQCDQIIVGTARKNSLTRLFEASVLNRLLELTTVPVEVIAGSEVSKYERYGIPAAIAALLALAFAVAD